MASPSPPGVCFKLAFTFPKCLRILRTVDFRKVYDQGTRYTCPYFAAFCLAEPLMAGPHVGFTTPRALGKAVLRNRMRRRMREAVRLELASLHPEESGRQWSIVFNPRRKTLDCAFTELQAEVRRLFIKCSQNSLPARQSGLTPARRGRSSSRSSSGTSA